MYTNRAGFFFLVQPETVKYLFNRLNEQLFIESELRHKIRNGKKCWMFTKHLFKSQLD